MNKVKISVIVNCYNGEKYLSKTLSSVLSQTYNNYEVVFFDNCSTSTHSTLFKGFVRAILITSSTFLTGIISIFSKSEYIVIPSAFCNTSKGLLAFPEGGGGGSEPQGKRSYPFRIN